MPIRQLQVLRLDVAVNDRRILRVQVCQRIEELVGPFENLVGVNRLPRALHHGREVVARNVLHDEESPFPLDEVVHDDRDSTVSEPVEDRGLALERLLEPSSVDDRLLDGNLAAECLINGKVDRAHSTLPEVFLDQVPILEHASSVEHLRLPRLTGQFDRSGIAAA